MTLSRHSANPSSSIPSFTTHVFLLKDTPIILSPPITYLSLPCLACSALPQPLASPSLVLLPTFPLWSSFPTLPSPPAPVLLSSGHEHTAKLCGHFVSHLFACPNVPPPPAPPSTTPTPKLDHFIAYALHCTCLHPSVTFAALYLLRPEGVLPCC
jgi:hypothetical protein